MELSELSLSGGNGACSLRCGHWSLGQPSLRSKHSVEGSLPSWVSRSTTSPIPRRAVRVVTEKAARADDLVDEAIDVRHGRSDPLVTHAKMLRLELLNVKAELERELEDFVLNCRKCGLDVHWVAGLGTQPGHWAHREPAPHGEPALS